MKCVILCAGKGTRIIPYSKETSKVMIKVNDKPLLHYIIEYWKQFTNEFIFVVGYKKDSIISYVKQLNIKAEFIEQTELKGIAHAISLVKENIEREFVVVLGDCFYYGSFEIPKTLKLGVGVYQTTNPEQIKLNYSLEIENALVKQVIEKPTEVHNSYCGMGVYFFDQRVFPYIEKTKASSLRGEIEITDVIQNMIDNRENIHPIFFNGSYVNMTYPTDVMSTEKSLLLKQQNVKYMICFSRLFWPPFKRLLQTRAKIVGDYILPVIKKDDEILALGCGKKVHHLFVSTYLKRKRKLNLTSIDITEKDHEELDTLAFNGGYLPFEDNAFDVTFSSIALHHIDNADFYLEELIRVTKKKILIFEDTYTNNFEKLLANTICKVSDTIVGDVGQRRSFKSLEEWKQTLATLPIKQWNIQRYYPHPIPWIPTRNIIIDIDK